MVAMDTAVVTRTKKSSTPWWLWLLCAFLLLLFLCCILPALAYWLFTKSKKSEETPSVPAPVITADAKPKEQKSPEKPMEKLGPVVPVLPPLPQPTRKKIPEASDHRRPENWHYGKQRIYYTPSESPTESAHSSISHSRPAFKMTQRDPADAADCGVAHVVRLDAEELKTGSKEQLQDEYRFHNSILGEYPSQQSPSQKTLPLSSESKASQTALTRRAQPQSKSSQRAEDRDREARSNVSFLGEPHSSLLPSAERNRNQHWKEKRTSKLKEKYFTQNYPRENITEEGYDQIQYRYVQHYAESESA